MGRQIKFRAWALDTKEMLPWEECMFDIWFDDPEDADLVVMQFTGMRDQDEREVYDGDIVRVTWPTMLADTYQVIWLDSDHKHFGCWALRTGCATITDYLNMFGEFKVIGNIYQNPELINGSSNKVPSLPVEVFDSQASAAGREPDQPEDAPLHEAHG